METTKRNDPVFFSETNFAIIDIWAEIELSTNNHAN